MPIYTFENKKTGKVYDDMMSIAEKEAFLKKEITALSTNTRYKFQEMLIKKK